MKCLVELSHWKDVKVLQKEDSGCIPTGYEWMIRYQGIECVDFDKFQEEFDLKDLNGFGSVADKVEAKYSHVHICNKGFSNGIGKISFVREKIGKDIPCLLALINQQNGKFHAVPVVYIDDIKIKVIWKAVKENEQIINQIYEFSFEDIISWHNACKGGRDIAWLEKRNN